MENQARVLSESQTIGGIKQQQFLGKNSTFNLKFGSIIIFSFDKQWKNWLYKKSSYNPDEKGCTRWEGTKEQA